ncbi:MAG TPA: GNAT family N-acetyltransferase [Planctomycetes bacterium]|nr:GNAT family N-acetyltransferase [Planctomycetota bacterium]HIN79595.1 GNAT family N-acetyltransferase [Planctomycetota bacterium]
MITYTDDLHGVLPEHLGGFFEGWPKPPSPETHLRILRGSSHFVLAVAPDGQVVGFVTAISDGVLNAYLPLLEVLPTHRHQGIATELVSRLLAHLGDLYAIDLHCDADVQPFYESLGLRVMGGMGLRNYAMQAGRNADEK